MQLGDVLEYCCLVSISWKLINLCVVKCAFLNYVNIIKTGGSVFPGVYIVHLKQTLCVTFQTEWLKTRQQLLVEDN